MIPQAFIQELLARVDVVDVVGKYVRLKKAGANFLGLCPFHGEKSPSFTVSPTKQFYHCFGCGAHGSAIGFLMEHSGLSYVEAIRDLAQTVGLQVPDEPRGGDAPPRADPGLLDVLARAARFYKERLKDSPRAITYLKNRGLTGETAARFAIGYAPEGWRGLQAAFAEYDAPVLLAAGLVIESEPQSDARTSTGPASAPLASSEPAAPSAPSAQATPSAQAAQAAQAAQRRRYDRFRDRIMFPIRNPRGQVIGFGGRVLDRGEPKYMNSPETPVFSKGRELYGLFEARDALRARNCAIVVEGYMDVVMLAQHGVGNAVATLGTSTTPDHVRKLLRMVDRVVFSFDGDNAGRKAAWRALEASLPHAADTKRIEFLFLPPEHDPDSYVRAHGADGFDRLLGEAQPLSEFMVRELSRRFDMATPEGRAGFLASARPLLQALPPAALRIQLVHRVADAGAVLPQELERFIAQGEGARSSQATGRRDAGAPHEGRDPRQPPEPDWDGGWADGRPAGGQGWARGSGGDGEGEGGSGGWRRAGGGSGGGGGGWKERGPGRFQGGARGRFQCRDGWRGRDGRRDDGPPMMRQRAAPPDLVRRVRLLSALHPALVRAPVDRGFLPGDLVAWFDLLSAQPEGASLVVLCEALRDRHPDLVARLERDAADDRSLVAEMTLEEARAEFDGAIAQLRDRRLREAMDALAAGGFAGDGARERYQELLNMRGRT